MTANSTSATEPNAASNVDDTAAFELPQSAPLPASQLALIKATVPVLQQHGEAITKEMYSTLIAAHPELRDIFSHTSQTTGAQPRALARAVLAYATYVDDLPKLAHAVERIAQKHASLYVRPEQYDVVGEYLMRAIGTVLGEAATGEIVEAWTAAYGVLAQVFVAREGELYRRDAQEGWGLPSSSSEGEGKEGRAGWREFMIEKKVVEAEGIVSFWLVPKGKNGNEGPALPRFLPGQYVSVQVPVPALGHKQCRQFSLSSAPTPGKGEGGQEGSNSSSRYYRVTVKREEKSKEFGLVSNLLHDEYHEGDTVCVSHPHGEFFLDVSSPSLSPVVLISAGVGATPLVSMLQALVVSSGAGANKEKRPISWIHTSRNEATQPFRDEVAAAVEGLRGRGWEVATHVHLTRDEGKRLEVRMLQREKELFVGDSGAEYFVCGPEEFMVQVRGALVEGLGVVRERVHLELFATGDVVEG